MGLIPILLIACLSTTFYFFINWLRFCNRTPSSSVEDRFLAVVILVVATILWPVVIPISLIAILKARVQSFSQWRSRHTSPSVTQSQYIHVKNSYKTESPGQVCAEKRRLPVSPFSETN